MPKTPSTDVRRIAAVSLLLGIATVLGAQSPTAAEPYLNPDLPVAQRVDDLVGRMTLAEKIAQMQSEAPAIPRLHVAEYDWWNEGLHGVARSGYATVFPQAIGLAATWDTALIGRVAEAISTEARAKYNEAQRQKNDSIFYGLTFWSPNVNIVRDPRWGRGQETYGEDPYLTGRIGAAFVQGLQGDDPRYLKVVATAKHFAVHSGPESERHTFDARITPHDLADTYLPAFRSLIVDAHAASLMCAYNAVDGTPSCANGMLLDKTLKRDWHFSGYVVSDCAAITDIAGGHRFEPDMPHAAAAAVKAGTDLSCGKEFAALLEAVQQKLIGAGEIDAAVKRLFTARFLLGMFDPPGKIPFSDIPFSANDSAVHAALSREAALASIVLLKNDRAVLPLRREPRSIAVIGPNADSLPALEGNYNAVASHPVTPLAALEERLPERVRYAQGSPYVDGVPLPVPRDVFETTILGKREPGLKAEFFNGMHFEGEPVVRRVDRHIEFDWNGAAPVPGVSAQSFSVRWTGSIAAPVPGTFSFGFSMAHCSTCDDAEAIDVWLDGKPVYTFRHAATHGRRSPTPPFELSFLDTRPHALRIEYSHDAPHFGAGLTFNWKPPIEALRKQAVAAANDSDVIVAFLGLSPEIEGEEMPIHLAGFEGGDRTAIELPESQLQLVAALAATGKPIVVVLMNGSAIALREVATQATAMLEAWYPGEAGGTAIVETLFGQHNPSGRLPVTFYAATAQLPPFDDYSMANRTYRYFRGNPLYPFGYGLSYTQFKYSNGRLATTSLQAGQPLRLDVDVTNVGPRDGDEAVEIYLVPKAKPSAPLRMLVGFQKVQIPCGATRTIHATIDPRQLSLVAADGTRSIEPGEYDLYVGGDQPSRVAGILIPFHIEGSLGLAP